MLKKCPPLLTLALAGAISAVSAVRLYAQDGEVRAEAQEAAVPPRAPFSFEERVVLIDELFRYDEAEPAVGHWHGNVFTASGVPAASIVIRRTEGGGYEIICSVTPGNMPHQQATQVEVVGRRVRFHAPLDPPDAGELIFEGLVSEGGQRLKGTVDWPVQLEEEGTFELARTPLPMQLESHVAYGGKLEVSPEFFFEIILCLAQTPGGNWVGHIDIPSQSVGGWMLDRITTEDNALKAHMGGSTPAIFDGAFGDDDRTFSGVFRQLGNEIPFTFERIDDYTGPVIAPLPQPPAPAVNPASNPGRPRSRPQYPVEPYPYLVRDVQVQHPDQHVLAGTLTVPQGGGPFPGVVLLSDTGPGDRDSLIYGHKWFLVLADHLARQGIASLRCDDRGIGKSTGRFTTATTSDFATDAEAMYNFMRAIDTINPEHIGFVGHGEGGSMATLAAPQVEGVKFIAMLAPMGVPGSEYLVAQTRHLLAQAPDVDVAIRDGVTDAQLALLRGTAAGESSERMNELAIEFLARKVDFDNALGDGARSSASSPSGRAVSSLLAQLSQPWRREFAGFDPLPSIRIAGCPILAVWGSLDMEADPAINRMPIMQAIGSVPFALTERVYDGLNHLFQPATTGRTSEYARSTVTMSEEVMADLSQWILGQ